MTSNIDKLNLVAPQLAGRAIWIVSETQEAIIDLYGQFHSLEIDDVYPDSEPIVYFRATEVKERRSSLVEGVWHEVWQIFGDVEVPLPVSRLENIELGRKERLITMQFFPRGTIEETNLLFHFGF